MKSYAQAIRNTARHHIYMERSHCFSEAELGVAHMVSASVMADVFDKDDDWTEFELRRQEHIQRSTVGEWWDEYCKSIEDDEDTPETMLEDSSRYMED